LHHWHTRESLWEHKRPLHHEEAQLQRQSNKTYSLAGTENAQMQGLGKQQQERWMPNWNKKKGGGLVATRCEKKKKMGGDQTPTQRAHTNKTKYDGPAWGEEWGGGNKGRARSFLSKTQVERRTEQKTKTRCYEFGGNQKNEEKKLWRDKKPRIQGKKGRKKPGFGRTRMCQKVKTVKKKISRKGQNEKKPIHLEGRGLFFLRS